MPNMRIPHFTSVLFLVCFLLPVFGQEEPCDADIGKKAMKLYEKGSNRKKNDKYKRLKYLKEALELEEDFAAAHFALAEERIRTAKYEGSSFAPAEQNLLAVERICPQFHSDVYYLLAEIYLGRKAWQKAVEYQKKFLAFLSDDEGKFARDYAKKVEEIERDLEYASFYAHAFANPVPFEPDVVQQVSGKDREYLPLLTPDNQYLYFTRQSEEKEKVRNTFIVSDEPKYKEEFTVAQRTGKTLFDAGSPMPPPFNQSKNENYGGATISLDNKELFLTVCKRGKGGYKNCDIYTSKYRYGYNKETRLEEWHWSPLENLGENVNTERGWESQPSLSGDGKSLYFATFREDSQQIDIFVSHRDANGNWGPAERLPEPINSEYHDKAPFIHSDSKTLYFASDRPMGFGGYDVYYTKQFGEEDWTTPKNIGYPINSEEDDHGFVVSTDGQQAFFSSDKLADKGNGLDIYSFELYKEARPAKVAFLGGTVTDEEGEPVKKGKLEIKNLKTKSIQEVKIDSMDGRYAAIVNLEESEEFVVNLKGGEDIAFESKVINFSDTTEEDVYREIAMKQEKLKVGEAYRLEDIYYETNSADLKPESKVMLQEFSTYLKAHPSIKIAIHGHTDDIGKPEDNLALSTDRAFSVTAYLQELGIDKARLEFKGFGETRPVTSNETPEGRALNRRTEFVILSK